MKLFKVYILCSMFVFSHCFADKEADALNFKLDKVVLALKANKWVKTDSASLQLSINATLTNSNLVSMRAQIMKNLNGIAMGDWHITQFNRSQDSSGLERLYVLARARINQSLLTDVNVKAKKASRPGAKYQVVNIDFSPSLKEIELVKKEVRQMIYEQVSNEIEGLNKQYPKQFYTLNKLIFLSPNQYSSLGQGRNKSNKISMMLMANKTPTSIAVSNEIEEYALLELASNRTEDSDN